MNGVNEASQIFTMSQFLVARLTVRNNGDSTLLVSHFLLNDSI